MIGHAMALFWIILLIGFVGVISYGGGYVDGRREGRHSKRDVKGRFTKADR